jgi:hypothetical protein
MAVLAASGFVADHALACLHARDELQLLELVEDPVDAGAAHAAVGRAQRVLDIERGQRAVLPVEHVQHRVSRGPAAVARCG